MPNLLKAGHLSRLLLNQAWYSHIKTWKFYKKHEAAT